jgi:hypothetical protein
MRRALVNPTTGRWIISLLLVVLGVRALVPAGFMPSTEKPFSFQICPDGFPAQLLKSSQGEHHQHHHGGGGDDEQPQPSDDSMRGEHCVFAPAAGAGPAPEGPLLSAVPPTQVRLQLETESAILSPQRFRRPPSRAPPTFS